MLSLKNTPNTFPQPVIKVLFFTIVLILLYVSGIKAQVGSLSERDMKKFEEAKALYFDRNFKGSEKILDRILASNVNFAEGYFLLGDIKMETGNPEEASEAYKMVVSSDSTSYPVVHKLIASAEFAMRDYAEAGQFYEKYLRLSVPGQEETESIEKRLEICRFRLELMNNPVVFEPVNLGPEVNTPDDEYVNTLTADEQQIFFTRRSRSKEEGFRQYVEDFYFSQISDDMWQEAMLLGSPVDSRGDAGAMSVSPGGRTMFFTSCYRNDSYGSCDLYKAKRQRGRWSKPSNLGEKINTELWDSQPSISPDGKTLYFASNRKGGYGSSDIWMAELQDDGSWGKAENLGASINTDGSEMAPFIHFDNKTLYFSSNGHMGMGGADLYYVRKDSSGRWGEPVNMGYPLNTYNDELAVIVNATGDKGYLSAVRKEGYGNYDLYEFRLPDKALPDPVTYMKGTIYDAVTNETLEAAFRLIDLEDGDTTMSATSSEEGEFLVCIPTDRDYALHVSKDNYLFHSEHFALRGIYEVTDPYLKDVYLQPIDTGKVMVLKNVFFDFDKYTLKPESKVELEKLVSFLVQNEEITIEIGGHTDSTGNRQYNLDLSAKRAGAVMKYLATRGIAPERMTARGYGFSKPVASNRTEEGRALNRRTEVKVTGVRR